MGEVVGTAGFFSDSREGKAAEGLEDVQLCGWVVRLHARDEVERLWEVVQRVEEDEVDCWCGGELGEHVYGDETSEAEGGCLVQIWEGEYGPI